jgi:hypothetical protein
MHTTKFILKKHSIALALYRKNANVNRSFFLCGEWEYCLIPNGLWFHKKINAGLYPLHFCCSRFETQALQAIPTKNAPFRGI